VAAHRRQQPIQPERLGQQVRHVPFVPVGEEVGVVGGQDHHRRVARQVEHALQRRPTVREQAGGAPAQRVAQHQIDAAGGPGHLRRGQPHGDDDVIALVAAALEHGALLGVLR
jgi:hypothetical protein